LELRQVVFHAPGPSWKTGVDFREQPGVLEHVQHYAKLHAQGKLLYGGPFTDVDAGGMMIADAGVTREELEAFAASDPAVVAGLLTFKVKTWYVAMAR
jgi:uncharacterized protein YciI